MVAGKALLFVVGGVITPERLLCPIGVLLQQGCEQVSEPSAEALPRRAPLLPFLRSEQERLAFLAVEEAIELVGGAWVDDDGVLFVIP